MGQDAECYRALMGSYGMLIYISVSVSKQSICQCYALSLSVRHPEHAECCHPAIRFLHSYSPAVVHLSLELACRPLPITFCLPGSRFALMKKAALSLMWWKLMFYNVELSRCFCVSRHACVPACRALKTELYLF